MSAALYLLAYYDGIRSLLWIERKYPSIISNSNSSGVEASSCESVKHLLPYRNLKTTKIYEKRGLLDASNGLF